MTDPSASSGSALSPVEWADRQSRIAGALVALAAGGTAWLSAGIVGFTGGDAARVAALPSLSILAIAMIAAVAAATAVRLRLAQAWPLTISFLLWLPYLPGPLPTVFMLWDGPIEWIVWAAVAAGMIYSTEVRLRAFAASADRTGPWLAGVLAVALSAWAFASVRDVVPNGDEPHYLVATQSLLLDRDLTVENNYTAGQYLDYFGGRLQPHFLQRSTTGEIYSIHSPGVSAIVLPGFAVAGYGGAVALMIMLSALTAALTWSTAWRVSGSVAGAWTGVAAVFVTAPFLFHTFTIYPDGLGALLVMTGVWLLVRLDDGWEPSPLGLAGAGAAMALLPWLHTRFALLAATLALLLIARLAVRPRAAGKVAAFVAIPVVAAIAWFAYFWAIWGTPSPFAPYGKDMESSASYIYRGLTGLLVDQQFGVLGTAPVYAMAIAGLAPLARRRPRLVIELLVIAVPYAIAVSTYAMWWGGTSAPARFIAAIVPLAALAIAAAWAVAWLRPVTLLLLMVSAALIVPRIEVDGGRLVFNSRNVLDPTIDWLNRHVDLALSLPSVHRDGAGGGWLAAAPWLLAIGLVAGDAFALSRLRAGRGAAWTLTALSGAALVMISVSIGWAVQGSPGITRDRSAIAALSGLDPWRTTFLDAKAWRAITGEAFLQRMAIDVPAQGHASLLRAARIPAGEYLVESLAPAPGGTIAAVVGRNDPRLEFAAASSLALRLPVALSSLSVRADSAAADGQTAMRIRPVGVAAPVNPDGRLAMRAARYGRGRVFVFDDRVYLEPKGFWTRAEGRATIVVDADEEARRAGLPIAVTAGAAATTIGISAGAWAQSFSLTPGERRDITLPALGDAPAWVVNVHSGPGFRPFEREPGNADVRLLAAWFEIH